MAAKKKVVFEGIHVPKTEFVKLSALNFASYNPRSISAGVMASLKASLIKNGMVLNLVVQRRGMTLIGGHQRVRAMRELCQEKKWVEPSDLPAVILDVDDLQAKQLNLSLNRIDADFDQTKLGEMFVDIKPIMSADDILATGFAMPEVDELINRFMDVGAVLPQDIDDAPPVPKRPMTKLGDVWRLGQHLLVCGDSRDPKVVAQVAQDADMLWTDPPYNVTYEGKTEDKLTIQNDSMTDPLFKQFLLDAFAAASSCMRSGAVLYIAHADTEGLNFRGAVVASGWKLAQCLIWVKDRFVMGRQDYHWRHEPILYGWKEGAGHHRLKDRTQDTIWEVARPARSAVHPTMKPVALIERAIRNSTTRGQLVLDTFAGSGSTLMACQVLDRRCGAVELDPGYCDVIVQRWETLSGEKATRHKGGE